MPLIASFLLATFKEENKLSLPETQLTDALYDFIGHINMGREEPLYPLGPREYLTKWTDDGFLTKSYKKNQDEAVFQLTSGSELALRWLGSLQKNTFVGTESKLLTILNLLENLMQNTNEDKDVHLAQLREQQQQIQEQIDAIAQGKPIESLDDTRILERFMETDRLARELLSDFREIEENFQALDQQARETQLKQSLGKGEIVGEVLDAHDKLWESDQGKSFAAFWELLMNPAQQANLDKMVHALKQLPQLDQLRRKSVLTRLKYNLVEVGEQVNQSNHQLVAQLRKFLDAQVLIEHKRMVATIDEIQNLALDLKEDIPLKKPFFSLPDKPHLDFSIVRPFFSPKEKPVVDSTVIEEGKSEASATRLFEQVYVNPEELRRNIKKLLRSQPSVTLDAVCNSYPISKGMRELITYFEIARQDPKATIDDSAQEVVSVNDPIKEQKGEAGHHQSFVIPKIVFSR